jgi:hypothetical protein
MGSATKKFREIASNPKFKGWPLVGDYKLGVKIPFFGQTLEYVLRTGNGNEDYVSLIRHFGWCVVFGVNEKSNVISLVQWKPGANKPGWELPPGGIGKIAPGTSQGEILEKTKEIYLKETGYGNGDWDYLGHILIETGKYRGAGPDDHGLPAHMMLATNLVQIQDSRQPNRNEIMETLEFPLDEIREVVESGLLEEASALPCALLACIKLGALKW